MAEAITWDDLEQADVTAPDKPFFAIDLTNDDLVLTWLKKELLTIKNRRTNYLERAKNNDLRYRGLQYFNAVYTPRDVLETQKKYTPQVVMPLVSDAIDEIVSRTMEIKAGIVVLPLHDETKDKVDAKIAKRYLQHIDREQKLDGKYQKCLRNSKVVGESFLLTRWNPDLGDKLQSLKIVPKEGEASSSDAKENHTAVFQGDVEVVNKTAQWVFYENADSWANVNYCFIVELDYVEGLKLDYPHLADKISEDSEARVFDFDTMEQISLKGKCRKITFYHKVTKYMPEGYEATFVTAALLKKGPLSYEHGELPIDRLIDIENDEELAGQSSIDKTRGIASTANNLLNAVIKMFMLAGHAKWFVQAGSVDETQLNNDVGIVKIKQGSNAPVLAQANPVGEAHFKFIDNLKTWFYGFMKSNSVIRGEPPPGVTAGVALQYVSEAESRRMSTGVANFNALRIGVNDKILKTAAQYYGDDDKRNMMLLGKGNRWETYPVDVAALKKDYAVLTENVSGLSDSKAVKTQQIIDLGDKYPDLVPREQVLEMTGLGQAEKFYDVGSAAARAAEDENESIQDGNGQIEPQIYEDHINHWKIHVQSIQPMGFKEKAGEEISRAMQDHIMAHEMLMMEIVARSPEFAQRITMECPQFPLFFEPPVAPPTIVDPATGQEVPPEMAPPPQAPEEIPMDAPIL